MSSAPPSNAGKQAGLSETSYSKGLPLGQIIAHFVILAICASAFGLTFWFEEVPPPLRRGMAPESFPRGVSLLAFVLTVASLVRIGFRGSFAKRSELPVTFYFSVVGCLLFLAIANFIDILVAMVLFIASVCWLWGERRRWVVITLSLVLPLVIFVLFSEALGIRFPRGLLIDVIYG